MSTPVHEDEQPSFNQAHVTTRSSEEDGTYVGEGSVEPDANRLHVQTDAGPTELSSPLSPSRTREQEHLLDDNLAILKAEREATNAQVVENGATLNRTASMNRSRSKRSDPVDEFDAATNPLHEKTSGYRPPEHPSTNFAKLIKRVHNSSILVRYFTYIVPVVLLLLIPVLLGALAFKGASVGGVSLMWFGVWLEIVFLTLFAGRLVAKCFPWPMGIIASLFTNNSKKWRDMGKQLEMPATIFFWWLGVEVSFLPTMTNHHLSGNNGIQKWEATVNKIIVSIFVGATLNFVEKILIQLIAISFHLRTYADRIELNKFQIASLTKLYQFSRQRIAMDDSDFEDDAPSKTTSGARTPAQYLDKAHKNAREALSKVGDVAGKVAMDFTGKNVVSSSHPHQVILNLLGTTKGSQVLARRLYRTFVRQDEDTIYSDDLKDAFDNPDEAEAAFNMFDKDMNGDISMEELESVCVEIGRERKSITASLKDLDSVVSKLDHVLSFIVFIIAVIVFISLISTSAAGVLTSLSGSVLGLSWLFSATAQEFLQSVVFVFVKHPFDVGDRVSIYGNTGPNMKGDDYFVKEIALLYTEFKKLEGHVVQAPNSYLNTLFILNMRRSGGLAEAVPLVLKFGTTLDQIDQLRSRLLEFVKAEKREYQGNIITEIRAVTEAYSITVNVVFFYKSNWQNELLRLQRRNKFICALMISMQELGIEGPLMRLPGQKYESPYYVEYVQAPGQGGVMAPPDSANAPAARGTGPSPDTPFIPNGPNAGGFAPYTSVLRHEPSTSGARAPTSRARGESLSAMSRRVDFSLGMRDVSSGDIIGDVYDDRSRSRVPDFSRSPTRTRDANNKSERANRISDEDRTGDCAMSKTTSRDIEAGSSRFSADSGVGHGPGPSWPPAMAHLRPSHSHSLIHRNRFFGGRNRGWSRNAADQELMEQGMADIPEEARRPTGGASDPEQGPDPPHAYLDPRTGTVGPMAVKLDTGSTAASATASAPRMTGTGNGKGLGFLRRSQTDDYEMRRMR